MKIRIELDKISGEIIDLAASSLLPAPSSGSTDSSLPPFASAGSGSVTSIPKDLSLPEAGVNFYLEPMELADYKSGMYQYPVKKISFTVPEADLARVSAWIHGTSATGLPALSATCTKRITDACISAVEEFFNRGESVNLFHAPFRIGWGYLMSDGTLRKMGNPITLKPITMAPLLGAYENVISDHEFSSMQEIRMHLQRLKVTIPPIDISEEVLPYVKGIAIYASHQGELFSGTEQIAGLRSFTVDGVPIRIWSYTRMGEDEVLAKVNADTSFRIIGSLDIEDVVSGISDKALPGAGSVLSDWSTFPTLPKENGGDSPGGGEGDNPENPGDSDEDSKKLPEHFRFTTEPLDLGRPEVEKWVRGVTLRGIFRREAEYMSISLYGSHHREKWHLLARSRGAHLRLLRSVRCRWLRIVLEGHAREEDRLDALTFDVNLDK